MPLIDSLPGDRVLFLGIGGSGMSSLAHILLDLGFGVLGYDKKSSDITDFLSERGAKIRNDLSGIETKDFDFIVYSSAVNDKNHSVYKEVQAFAKPMFHRSDVLHRVFERGKSISVAGSHGKTSTTAMVSQILETEKKDPTIMIGGDTALLGKRGGKAGKGEWGVYESDESDGTFLKHSANIRIATNVDNDHLDHYGDRQKLEVAFQSYLGPLLPGHAIVQGQDPGIQSVLARIATEPTFSKNFHLWILLPSFWDVSDSLLKELKLKLGDRLHLIHFQFEEDRLNVKVSEVRFQLNLPFSGTHYLLNGLCAATAAFIAGIEWEKSASILSEYVGVKRRQEVLGIKDGITVMDDYGHHPTEIKTVIESIQNSKKGNGKLVVLFQPHRYTRTDLLQKELAEALSSSEVLYLLPIYSAGEKEIPGVSTSTIAKHITALEPKVLSGNIEEDLTLIRKSIANGDILLCLGAGNVRSWGEAFLEEKKVD